MKKFLVTLTVVLLAVVLGACAKKETTKVYFAAADDFAKSYRYFVTVEKKGDKITSVEWNGYHIDGGESSCLGDDKLTCSNKGNYGMESRATLGSWEEQAKAAAKWVVDNQKTDVTFDDTGHADAVTTVSIHTKEMFDLINEALNNDPIEKGDYKDGFYYIETEKGEKTTEFAKQVEGDAAIELENVSETYDTYTFGTFVVVNGTIVLADFNATQNIYEYVIDTDGKFVKDENGTPDNTSDDLNIILMIEDENNAGQYVPKNSYVTKDAAGDWYGMSQAGKTEWNKQVEDAEEALVKDQKLTFTDEGIDGVTSVTIHVDAFKTIFEDFEAEAK